MWIAVFGSCLCLFSKECPQLFGIFEAQLDLPHFSLLQVEFRHEILADVSSDGLDGRGQEAAVIDLAPVSNRDRLHHRTLTYAR